MFSETIKKLSSDLRSEMAGSGRTVATAESCTSGLIASALTVVSGSSEYVRGGVVAYASEVKTNLLGVSSEIIAKHDVVSEEVVSEMVRGALKTFGSTYAVASTGVAGPSGGTEEIPVGTIWIAVGSEERIVTKCLSGDHGREQNTDNAVAEVLKLLLEFVRG